MGVDPLTCAFPFAFAFSYTQTDIVILSTAFIGVAGSCLGLVTAIPSEVLTHRQRAAGLSFVFTASATAPFAALLGISSAITRDAVNGWRWMFYVAIIVSLVHLSRVCCKL